MHDIYTNGIEAMLEGVLTNASERKKERTRERLNEINQAWEYVVLV